MARVILGILIFLSISSWAIIFQKWVQLGGVQRKTNRFLQMFRAGGTSSRSPDAESGLEWHAADRGLRCGLRRIARAA